MLPSKVELINPIKTFTLGSAIATKNDSKNTISEINASELCLGKSAPIASPIGNILILTPVKKRAIPNVASTV